MLLTQFLTSGSNYQEGRKTAIASFRRGKYNPSSIEHNLNQCTEIILDTVN